MSEAATDTPSYVVRLAQALEELGDALIECRANGLQPADAFRAAGIDIPAFAAPMLNTMLPK